MKRGRKKGYKLTEEEKLSQKNNRDKLTKKNVIDIKRFIIDNYGMQGLKTLRMNFVGKKTKKLNVYIKLVKRLAGLGYSYEEIGQVAQKNRATIGYICKNK